MSLTSTAMIGLFTIVALLIVRAKLREKDAEIAAMATMMGTQNVSPETADEVLEQSLQKVAPEVIPELKKVVASGHSGVHEWSFGDKPEDMSKPGIHSRTTVKVQITRKKL